MVKVSVILPSLNVKTYIQECVESVINQTLTDIEIICVDAGSTDGTLEILKEYEKKDSRIKVLLSDRKSYGYQMNLGMDSARGEYIGIVETDDFVPPEMYEELYAVAAFNSLDFVKADFYRFKGERGEYSKAYQKIDFQNKLYNKVLRPRDAKECFAFPINTWSGIYKRSYLQHNHIRHNESPGASYQDNGFWFQTFMFAERGYFVNKAYYMNRRDNPGSSVYSKDKVYVICDEYDYIRRITARDQKLYDEMKFVLSYAQFMNYKGTLNRIAEEYKQDFLKRFCEDFRKLRDENALDMNVYSETDWQILLFIMDDPMEYYRKDMEGRNEIVAYARQFENVIIYGAGMIGRRTLQELLYNSDPVPVMCFAVTHASDNLDSFQSTPIYEIGKLTEYCENGLVIIATTKKYQAEMEKTLKELGFQHYVAVPDSLNEDGHGDNDEEKLKNWYQRVTGKELCLRTLRTFNEKQQWLKLNDQNELKYYLTDKCHMRDWVSEKLGESFLVPLVGIYKNVEEIDFDSLPNRFIIKCSHGSNWNSNIEDKSMVDSIQWETYKRRISECLKMNYKNSYAFGLGYGMDEPRILIEEAVDGCLQHDNYKILCFEGVPQYIIHDTNKKVWGDRRRDIFDTNWNHIEAVIKYPNAEDRAQRPEALDRMIEIAKKLSKDFKFAVIHLFNSKNGVLFNEIKFAFGNGVEKVLPEAFDRKLGEGIRIWMK